ncbi:DMT family transporter [Thermosipho ferrireducens]|uniref:DMT family transporter n=1 Tax=Thermosipho ferrireducens TaxID=2571116 RepID=A0ABX7S4X9_9BACT|nr:DMT family transporter [Thermosipho ferrireducens]QTA37527.1 DMT family transporter [Thermosipho ferrireducens]
MHYITAIISAFSSSVTSIFGKLSLNIGASAVQILFLRFLFTFLVAFSVFMIKRKKIDIKKLFLFGGLGILNYGIAAYFFFEGLNYLNPAYATVLYYTNPIFVVLFRLFFYKDKMSILNWIAVFVSFTGVIFANYGEKEFAVGNSLLYGTLLVLVSAILSAFFVTVAGKKLKNASNTTVDSVFYTFTGVFLYYFVLIISLREFVSIEIEFMGYALVLAIFSTFIPLTLNFFSLKKLGAHTLAIIMPLELVFASLLSFFIFGEGFNLLKLFGFILVGFAPIIERLKVIKNE